MTRRWRGWRAATAWRASDAGAPAIDAGAPEPWGGWLAPLGLRLILAWEFFESGREKLLGANWFAQLGDRFPWPFSALGAGLNWSLATWFELAGSLALLLGLGTRFAAYSLWVLTIVATYAVHWPGDWASLGQLWQGYAITNKGFGNYKLPLLYLVMLLPLMLNGGYSYFMRIPMDAAYAIPYGILFAAVIVRLLGKIARSVRYG